MSTQNYRNVSLIHPFNHNTSNPNAREWGRPGKELDERSVAWGCEELLGWFGWDFLSGLATVASCEDDVESVKMCKKATWASSAGDSTNSINSTNSTTCFLTHLVCMTYICECFTNLQIGSVSQEWSWFVKIYVAKLLLCHEWVTLWAVFICRQLLEFTKSSGSKKQKAKQGWWDVTLCDVVIALQFDSVQTLLIK